PNDTHFPLAKAALEAGKHVVVDKPFTVTLSQARELDALAKSLGRVLSVFHNRRWDSDFLTLKGLLAEGVLGEVAYFESHFDRFRPQVRDRWREQGGPGSGIWYDLAPHLLDQAITLFGLPVSMTVDLAQLRPGRARNQGRMEGFARITIPNQPNTD
ncbi:Gfo/Idh/MocA family oxidoreductase, partial [Escherichia coli]